MIKDEIVTAFRALGERCEDLECVIVGSAAAILSGWVNRGTLDVDVVYSNPKLSAYSREISETAEELGLPEKWMNDTAAAWRDVLPPDFRDRLQQIGRFGGFLISSVSRQDLILLKFHSLRPEDVADLQELSPTEEEIEYVRSQLDRIAKFDAPSAHKMELYLDQQ